MKTPLWKILALGLLLGSGLATSGTAVAHGDEDHTGASAAQAVPATVPATWQAIDQKMAELKQTIASGSLAQVHHQAYAVRDLVAALPARSGTLPADKQAVVKANVKFVATLAERLDTAGDSNNQADAQANYDKLVKVLATLRANYSK